MAFTVVEPDLSYRDLTLGELADLSASFAAGLADLGVGPGDAVATLMGRSADLVVALALRASDDQPAGYRLRRASSAGEPLTPDIVTWSKATLGTEVRDQYGQTEHGMLIVNGWHGDVRCAVRPGSTR